MAYLPRITGPTCNLVKDTVGEEMSECDVMVKSGGGKDFVLMMGLGQGFFNNYHLS
jgi:hypothetical protein